MRAPAAVVTPHARSRRTRECRRAARRARRARSCALALSACGAKQDVTTAPAAKPFTVMLDWFPNADHAPLYSAIAAGDFRAVGLEVQPVVPSETAEPLKLLAAGKVDMAISYEPELLLARDEGLKLVSIGGARAAPADVDHRAARRSTSRGRRPRRQDRRHGRHPLPGGRAEDRPAERRRQSRERCKK